MEPSRIHDFASFTSYINTKLVTLKKMEARFEIFEWISLNCHNFQSFHARKIGIKKKKKLKMAQCN